MTTTALFLTVITGLLPAPRCRGVSPEDANRIEKGIKDVLSEQSWIGKNLLSATQREAVAARYRKEFERHSRKFTSEEVSKFLKRYRFAYVPGHDSDPVTDELLGTYFKETLPNNVELFSKWCDWYPAQAKVAERQLRELVDHAVAEFDARFGVLNGHGTVRQAVLDHLKRERQWDCRSVSEGLKRWALDWALNSLEAGEWTRVRKEDSEGEGSLADKKKKISNFIRTIGTGEAVGSAYLCGLAGRAERLDGEARSSLLRLIGSHVVSDLFLRISAFVLS